METIWHDQAADSTILPTIEKSRHYSNIFITGDDIQDKKKLDSIQNVIRIMIQKCDTVNGIHIKYGEKAKYQSLIRTLDICAIELAYNFTLSDNNMWIMYSPPLEDTSSYSNSFVCGTPAIQRHEWYVNFREEMARERELKYLGLWKPFLPSALLFCMLTILAFIAIRKRKASAANSR